MSSKLKSRKFVLTVISIIGLLIPTILGALSPELAAKIAGYLVGIYLIANVLVKFTPSKADDEIVSKINDAIISKIPEVYKTKATKKKLEK